MRCERLNGSLSAEESVEPIPGQAEFLSGRLRLCTRMTHPGVVPVAARSRGPGVAKPSTRSRPCTATSTGLPRTNGLAGVVRCRSRTMFGNDAGDGIGSGSRQFVILACNFGDHDRDLAAGSQPACDLTPEADPNGTTCGTPCSRDVAERDLSLPRWRRSRSPLWFEDGSDFQKAIADRLGGEVEFVAFLMERTQLRPGSIESRDGGWRTRSPRLRRASPAQGRS